MEHKHSRFKQLQKLCTKDQLGGDDKNQLISHLSVLFLEYKYTEDVCKICRPVILDIVNRAADITSKTEEYDKIFVALSRGIVFCPDLKSYAADYLFKSTTNLPFHNIENRQHNKQDTVEIAKATWRFLKEMGDSIKNILQLDSILQFLEQNKENVEATWYITNAVSEMVSMSSVQREEFIGNFIKDSEVLMEYRVRHATDHLGSGLLGRNTPLEGLVTKIQEALSGLDGDDLHQNVVMVAGIMLQKSVVKESLTTTLGLIPVESTVSHLRSLALAVASGNPVLLQGPVGCGKTSLVEHLAQVTGRQISPSLMKIQLGDQTDSKALLGTYRCTDIPGEFLWQPGILTQAVIEGHWVLLEDIDSAPMDVVSVLLPLLERNALSLPGHGDNIHTSPNFRLFGTQRLLGSHSGWHRQHNSSSVLLEKMWTKINVEPLSRSELEMVITTKYPDLKPVVDRLLDIYFMLSAGKHTGSEEESVGKFLSHDGRLISTRDLMTWCKRIAKDFDISSTATANLVMQEALDCFVSCLTSSEKRLMVAEAIGAKLNVNKVKAEFYSCKYKPEVKISQNNYSVGRALLQRNITDKVKMNRSYSTFSFTRQSSALLEKVAVCVMNSEPVILVGETGTGKTSSVQYLAQQLGHNLKVVNMNQQSDSSDLLGGFKPVDMKHVVKPFHEDYEILFCETFSRKENAKFIKHMQDCYVKKKWNMLFTLMEHTMRPAFQRLEAGKLSEDHSNRWKSIKHRLQQLKVQVQQSENVLAFSFIEGTLVKALRNGDWVLLDEINLAAAETLECLSGLLESQAGSLVLTERGDMEQVVRNENFRLFACMNPATDVGKKDLPIGIRNRFTEFYVDELEDTQDLKILVSDYLRGLAPTSAQIDGIVKFYLNVREEAAKKLTDGTGHRPHFSLRTLCRALRYASTNPCGQVARSLYEGFCLSFLTQLDRSSHPAVETLICKHILGNSNIKSILKQPIPMPSKGKYLNFEGYWISVGKDKPVVPEHYILTPSVRQNLKDLCRVISGGQHPVLLQGETSVGKTSLVTYLAKSTGNHCVRVNNHEHTDLQEYVGCYSADDTGKLAFKEGVLVEAMRKGHWIILDELNLAPTDVLEALNRLLDDNRELFIPETQETVKAHPKFMLFATQNPPGHYGGRKMLSRAFRNRFIELHFDVIPSGELETILHERCSIPMSYSKKLVAVMLELQTRRRGSGVFAGKQGFMTLRDLFRWAERYKCQTAAKNKFYDWEQHMADHGYMVLAGRVRKPEESLVISEVIQKHFKRSVDPDKLFTLTQKTSCTTVDLLKSVITESPKDFSHVVWTYNMRRLAVLIGQAILFKEPILLVGETGCGKTTMCQLLSALKNTPLFSINCHLHTESADFLGGLRPCRSHDQDGPQKLFEWVDGPLVTSMKDGAMFLIDEISLADDSVLERLNSVLEPEQMILLAEKGGGEGTLTDVELVKAEEGFQVFATMNPGGDFGKKELSPALRNRFTEIWCPQTSQRQDFIDIIEHNIKSGIHLCNMEDGTSGIGKAIIDFIEWFSNNDFGKRCTMSIRDILSWVNFINVTAKTLNDEDNTEYNKLDPPLAFIHGACLVFLDGLGSGTTSRGTDSEIEQTRQVALQFLLKQVSHMTHQTFDLHALGLVDKCSKVTMDIVKVMEDKFCIWPFSISRGREGDTSKDNYALQAPTTCVNAQRILRGLQLPRPLLLEGSPGIGKTSLVAAIAKAAGRHLVRINLSEQTDVTDLFGADLPVEGAEGGVFAWRDGPLLQALKAGHWVVLDELNLASQSVLEGLNACLDHRAEVYIPELSKTFHIQHEKTRLFACQNPLNQGGGRKGLPRSFLNRFTQVYVEPLTSEDQMFITTIMYPNVPQDLLQIMVNFNIQINRETVVERKWGQKGSPWEFNLRDLFRWCQLLLSNQRADNLNPGEYVPLLYEARMRTVSDKHTVGELFQRVFPDQFLFYQSTKNFSITSTEVQCGHSFLPRMQHCQPLNNQESVLILHHCLEPLESVMKCVEMNWLSILIGPQSSGKTSLVQLLATLCGQDLQVLAMNSSMDTTELLGGFEQSDPARHIEDLGNEIHAILTEIEEFLLCKGDVRQVKDLHQYWKNYRQASKHADQISSIEELQQMKKQVNCLVKLSKECSASVQKYMDLNDLVLVCSGVDEKLEKLRQRLADSKAGTGGGTFEWVDSILVTALQKGQWLLIDNVNFCSPSVLDRLNALLEPNGELIINERGVIDGKIPAIRPHPNFRLFLAMDPKFGEISRAMRNRGVEIYITGEEEGIPYSSSDLKLMLQNLGFIWIKACDWLISFHQLLRSELPRGEQPTMLDLLCAATAAKQQIDRGIPLDKALYHATNDIYIKSVKYLTTKQIAKTIWSRKCEELEGVDLYSEVMDHMVPTVSDYISDVKMAGVLQHGFGITNICRAIRMNTQDISPEISKATSTHLKYAFYIFMNNIPLNQRSLYVNWMVNYTSRLKHDLGRCGDGLHQELISAVTDKSGFITKAVSSLYDSGILENLKTSIAELLPVAKDAISEMPFDLHWNQQLLYRLTVMYNLDEKQISDLHWCLNKFWLLQSVILSIYQDSSKLDEIGNKLHGIGKKSKIEDKMVLEDVYRLMVRADDFIQMISSVQITSFQDVVQLLEAFKWRSLLIDVVEKCYSDLADIHTMTLYWNWFYDKFIPLAIDRSSSEFKTIVQHVHGKLGQNNELGKRYIKFWKSSGHPRPFRTEIESQYMLYLIDLMKQIDLHKPFVKLVTLPKVRLHVTEGRAVTDMLLTCLREVTSDNYKDNLDAVQKKISEIRKILLQYGIKSNSVDKHIKAIMSSQSESTPMDVDQSEDSLDNKYDKLEMIGLWPLYETIMSMSGRYMMCGEWKKTDVDMFTDYCLENTPVSPSLISVWKQACDSQKNIKELKPLLKMMSFKSLWNLTPAQYVNRWIDINQESDITETPAGPQYLYTPTMSYIVLHHLSHNSQQIGIKSTETQLQPLQVPLGTFTAEIQKMDRMSEQMWCHGGVLGSDQYSARDTEKRNLMLEIHHVISSVLQILPEEKRLSYEKGVCISEMLNKLLECCTKQNYSLNPFEYIDSRHFSEICLKIFHSVLLNSKVAYNFSVSIQKILEEFYNKCLKTGGAGIFNEVEPASLQDIGVSWVWIGMILIELLTPYLAVDPVEKVAIKLEILQNELMEIEHELSVRNTNHRLLTSESLEHHPDHLQHPHMVHLRKTKITLKQKIKNLQEQMAYRPSPSQFRLLVSLITNFKSSIGSISHVTKLLKKLENTTVTMSTAFSEEEAWQKSVTSLVTNLEENFPHYKDITVPFLLAVYQMKHGMRLVVTDMKQRIYQLELARNLKIQNTDILTDVVTQLCRFPTVSASHPDFLSLAEKINMLPIQALIAALVPEKQDISVASLRKSGLELVICDGFIRKELTHHVIFTLSQLLTKFLVAWQQQEERRKRKEEEEASLYRYKSQVHGDERKEEEREEAEFRQNFPSFEQDFMDVSGHNSLESTTPNPITVECTDVSQDSISTDDMNFVSRAHSDIFIALTHSDWLKQTLGSVQIKGQDTVKPVLKNYLVMTSLMKIAYPYLNEKIDTEMFGGHLLVASEVKRLILQQDPQITEDYDVYHDSNVSEAIKCLPVMDRLVVRVNQLQLEWPDHPTLKQLIVIVDRIKSFAVTSPVVKFLTGLELLLEKAQDWERNAAKHVSMMSELSEITEVIIQWRKLELSCWSKCLDTVERKHSKQASRWWFHLYQLIQSYIQAEENDDSDTPSVSEADILKSLEEFIEKSTLGEFTSRLKMLLSFHCQLVHMDHSDKQGYLLNLLWNLYQFYSQFKVTVEDEIQHLRAPVEKELKGFVKIARWTDMNYWALKATTDKTHRTLHKHIKSFQDILHQPVRSILQEKSAPTDDKSKWREEFTELDFTVKKPSMTSQVVTPEFDCALLKRVPTLCMKMYKHWTELVNKIQYSDMVSEMDEFVGDVIEEYHELQTKEVNKSLEREKQLSEAKHICQLRRRALADLFKYLTASGLSYRKGLTIASQSNTSSQPLTVDPIDFSVLMDQCQSRHKEMVCSTWQGCKEYFYRCISRKAKLASALMAPSQELGVGNIDRCRGFTEQLMSVVVQQHRNLSAIAKHFKSVSSALASLTTVTMTDDNVVQPCQTDVTRWHEDFKGLATSLIEGLMQFEALLYACPKPSQRETTHPSPIAVENLTEMSLVRQGDQTWDKCMKCIQTIKGHCLSVQDTLIQSNRNQIWTWKSLKTLQTIAEDLKKFIPDLQHTVSLFNTPGTRSQCHFTSTLSYLSRTIDNKLIDFKRWYTKEEQKITQKVCVNFVNSEDVIRFGSVAEELISSVLLVVQNIKTNHENEAPVINDDDKVPEPVQFVKEVVDKLNQDTGSVLSPKVASSIQRLMGDLITLWNSPDTDSVQSSLSCCKVLSHCMPLLHQYCDVVEYYLVQNLASNRTTAKLLSVLLGIFTELASKGFCTPEEFSDEIAGEGATQFEDIEGGGMGEGEGVKDVSDQIENEDQLDEAQKQGEKPEQSTDQPDIASEDNAIEMSDDIEGKLHDLEPQEGENEDDDEGDDNEEEMDKQMGDVDGPDSDKLDEQMWGSDEETEQQEDQKEEDGPGSGQESKSELVAKDDNQGADDDKNQDPQTENQDTQDDENKQPNELNEMDMSEYDEDKVDPYQNEKEPQKPPEGMDLPDDLNLDDDLDKDEETAEDQDATEKEEQTGDMETQDGIDKEEDINMKEEEDKSDEPEVREDEPEGTEKEKPDDEDNDRQKEEGQNEPGFSAQEPDDEAQDDQNKEKDPEEQPQGAEVKGQTSHDTQEVEQSDTAHDQAGQSENNQEEAEGTGTSQSEMEEGHQGQSSSKVTQGSSSQQQKQLKRKPGRSDMDRSLGSVEQKYKRLKTTDTPAAEDNQEEDIDKTEADLYEHIKEASSRHDTQTIDTATADQQQEQPITEQNGEECKEEEDVDMAEDEDQGEQNEDVEMQSATKLKNKKDKLQKNADVEGLEDSPESEKTEIPGDVIDTLSVARGPESTIHTQIEHLHTDEVKSEVNVEKLREELENQLTTWSHTEKDQSLTEEAAAEAWNQYEVLTSALSQDLCEQLRLILEPSQATKLKGDYRTGKRLNMRKVIPYIASQFRKDKIWLRRTKPSKRQYQIMLAIDDSSSMVDNHSKQLAFESLSMISNALTLLEAGELAICSFGESVQFVHDFSEQFSNQSGAKLLQHFTFEQKKTKIAQLLKHATVHMMDARSRQHGMMGNPDTAQLLLIVSDGRGLFMEGMETVKSAVRQARESNIFSVFVIIDNPQAKDSILDIRVPVFKGPNNMPEIKPYMDHFPFPFYIILRDINSLPQVLCDALRQWFELVTSTD